MYENPYFTSHITIVFSALHSSTVESAFRSRNYHHLEYSFIYSFHKSFSVYPVSLTLLSTVDTTVDQTKISDMLVGETKNNSNKNIKYVILE